MQRGIIMGRRIKTLLLKLPENIHKPTEFSALLQPYGLAIISSVLKKHGHNVTLFDARANKFNRNRILQYIKKLQPSIIGMTSFTSDLAQSVEFFKDVKILLPNVVTVIGGPHPTIEHKSILENHPEVDITVMGEGEYTMLEIIDSLQNGGQLTKIKGMAFRIDGKIRVNPPREYIENLDSLPFADWSSLPMNKYIHRWAVKKNYAAINTTRGCGFRCTFCVHSFIGKKFRRRSPDHALEEIKLLYDKYHVRTIEFTDSTMNADKKWLMELCEGIMKLNRPISWGCEYRADIADKETLSLMKKSGCKFLFCGVESADNSMLKRMKKGTTIEKIRAGIDIMNEVGIYPDIGFIIGMPGETHKTIKESITFAQKYPKSSFTFSYATPFPGSELYETARKDGFEVKDWSKHNMYKLCYVPKGLKKEDLSYFHKLAIKKVFLRPVYMINQIFQIKSWLHFITTIRFAYRLLFKRFS